MDVVADVGGHISKIQSRDILWAHIQTNDQPCYWFRLRSFNLMGLRFDQMLMGLHMYPDFVQICLETCPFKITLQISSFGNFERHVVRTRLMKSKAFYLLVQTLNTDSHVEGELGEKSLSFFFLRVQRDVRSPIRNLVLTIGSNNLT